MGRITQREYACFQWNTLKPTALNSRATILLIPEDAPVTNATLLITKKGILVKKRRGSIISTRPFCRWSLTNQFSTYSLPCTRAMSRWNNHGNFHFHSPAVIHRWMVDYKTFIRSRYVQSFEVDDYCGPCNRLNAFRWLLEDRVLHAFRVHGNREMVQQQEGVGCVNKE